MTAAQVVHGKVFFQTLIPAAKPCGAATGRYYALDTLRGLPSDTAVTGFVTLPPIAGTPQLLDTAVELTTIGPFGKVRVKRKYLPIDPAQTEETSGLPPGSWPAGESLLPAGRLSWREIVNWQELRDAANAK